MEELEEFLILGISFGDAHIRSAAVNVEMGLAVVGAEDVFRIGAVEQEDALFHLTGGDIVVVVKNPCTL